MGALSLFWLAGVGLMLMAFSSGRGMAAAAWTVLPLLVLWSFLLGSRARWPMVALTAVTFGGLLWAYPKSNLSSNQTFPTVWDYLFNFVPEHDLARFGVMLAYGPPLSDHVLGLLDPLYEEIGEQYGPHVVGSTASDLFLRRPGRLHYYRSEPVGGSAKGVVVFYHGALGGFQAYLHFWKRWADKNGWAVVCPSNGFGRWFERDGPQRALQSFDEAVASHPGVPVLVVGLSNGATAAMRVVNARPEQTSGLMLVCPVLEQEQVQEPGFLGWTRSHPAPVVLEGTDDVNVPPEFVQLGIAAIKSGGGEVEYILLEGHDHHILFSAADEAYRLIDGLAEAVTTPQPKSL